MKVVVRLILLAGLAAVVALFVREPLAGRVGRRLAGATGALSLLAPNPAAPSAAAPHAMLPMLPDPSGSTAPILPILPLARSAAPAPAAKHTAAKKPAAKPLVVTRKEVEDAIATRLSGVRAVLVRDAEGKPLGLRLSRVSRLSAFGVQEGDVLISANGLPLRTADEAASALGVLKDATRVTFALRRGDSTFGIPLELAE